MDLLHDVWALPGQLGRGLVGSHARADSDATSASTTTVGLLSPLRRLLRVSRAPLSSYQRSPQVPVTPRTPVDEQQHHKPIRIQALRVALDKAEAYRDWLEAATELDELEGNTEWKFDQNSQEYDVDLVRSRLRQMEEVRISRDQKKMFMLVRTGLTRNLGNMGNQRLYKHSHLGTKALIEQYIESVQQTIDALVETTKHGQGPMDPSHVLQELLLTRQAFGRSALLLSGGGTFGMNHIGVVKSLFEANLLPRIVSGASAGSIVSSVLCTRTDDEIPELMRTFCFGDLAVFEKPGQETNLLGKAYRFMTSGSLFDISNLTGVMKDLLGDITFQEAHNRTRRILNICVSNASVYELPRLLNYITAPNVLIWSAVAASCSVPLVFDPGQLLTKSPNGGYEPWDESSTKYIDGSVENDIPTTRLAEMFNVNHFIVSQVNPHVVPFLEKEEHDVKKDAQRNGSTHASGPTLTQMLTTFAKEETMHRLQMIQELGILPNVISKLRGVVGQKYAGDITIFPQISYANFPYVLTNPTSEFMIAATLSGERATWPKLSEIRNHCAIELAIDDAVHQLMSSVAFGPCQLDTHSLNVLGYNLTDSAQRARAQNTRPEHRTLRTSLDLPRLGLRAPSSGYNRPVSSSNNISGLTMSLERRATSPFTSLQQYKDDESTTDIHDFSASEAEEDDDDGDTSWDRDYDDDEEETASSDSFSVRGDHSPPGPELSSSMWPSTRKLFPWASQPATPSAFSTSFTLSPLSMTRADASISAALQTNEPSEAERRYKQLFHPRAASSGEGPSSLMMTPPGYEEGGAAHGSLRQRAKSVLQFDVSGARGMMRRRKMSFGLTTRQD